MGIRRIRIITASLCTRHVLLGLAGTSVTQCSYYFHAHYGWWKILSSQGRASQQRCPFGCRNARWSRGAAPDRSHTQSGLRESSGGRRRSVPAGCSQTCHSFPFIYFTFPALLYSPFPELKGGHEAKGAFAHPTRHVLVFSLRLGLTAFATTRQMQLGHSAFFQHALRAQLGIIYMVAARPSFN